MTTFLCSVELYMGFEATVDLGQLQIPFLGGVCRNQGTEQRDHREGPAV